MEFPQHGTGGNALFISSLSPNPSCGKAQCHYLQSQGWQEMWTRKASWAERQSLECNTCKTERRRRCRVLADTSSGRQVLQTCSAAEWQGAFSKDAWRLVLRTVLRDCGQSCWQYSRPGLPPTCRHGMCHVVVFSEYDVEGRRPGNKG